MKMRYWVLFAMWCLGFGASRGASATVTIIEPSGGEILCINQSFTIEFTISGHPHGALYYKTDGTQPANAQGASDLDPSIIQHPVQDQDTTWSWTPNSSHISQTGRIWIEGHVASHQSAGTWDQSDGNFTVKDCAGSTSGGGINVEPGEGGSTSPVYTQAVPTPVEAIPTATTSLRYVFQLPGTFLSSVELFTTIQTQDEQFAKLRIGATSTIRLAPYAHHYIQETGLRANTRYADRFLRGIVAPFGYLTAFSHAYEPLYTHIETPALVAAHVTSARVIVAAGEALSNLQEGLSGVIYTNLTTGESSDWAKNLSWTWDGLDPDSTYQFIARARNGDGVETPDTNLLTVKTSPFPLQGTPVMPVTSAATAVPTFPPKLPEGTLTRTAGDYRVWRIEQGFRRHIPTADAFQGAGYRWEDVRIISTEELLVFPPVRLARATGEEAVWLLVEDARRWIPSPEIFQRHRFEWDKVREVSREVLAWYRPVMLFRAFDDARVWFVEQGLRRWVTSLAVFRVRGFNWMDVATVLPEEVAAYPEGIPLQ